MERHYGYVVISPYKLDSAIFLFFHSYTRSSTNQAKRWTVTHASNSSDKMND